MLQSEVYKKYRINIDFDECPENPRQWCNLGTIYSNCKDLHADGFSIDDMEDAFTEDGYFKKSFLKNNIIVPIYFYNHSGFALFTDASDVQRCPHFRWDGGRFGYIVCSREKARKELLKKRLTKEDVNLIKKGLSSEIEIYNRYVNGEVYEYTVEDENGDTVWSCGGYFDEIDYVVNEAKEEIDAWRKVA